LINSQDRSYYFGASDTSMIVGKWNTLTFEKWWLEKIGIYKNEIKTDAMLAGTYYEHKILDSLGIELLEKDKQFIKDRLRVNLDGNTDDCIYEVKTHNINKEFKISKQYWRQAQVEMYGSGIHKLNIVAYGLNDKDYQNYFNEIDKERIEFYPIEYDEKFIQDEYLPKLEKLTECLKKGEYPCKQQEY
jgi:hypothetical protein